MNCVIWLEFGMNVGMNFALKPFCLNCLEPGQIFFGCVSILGRLFSNYCSGFVLDLLHGIEAIGAEIFHVSQRL